MTIANPGKYLAAWLVMLLVSIANGALRELIYEKYMSELAAHQLSTLTGILLLGFVIRTFVHLLPPASARQAIFIGLLWLAMTLAFEFLFFHLITGHSWSQLLANYDIRNGRVWIFVPLWIAVAPYAFFHFRRMRLQAKLQTAQASQISKSTQSTGE